MFDMPMREIYIRPYAYSVITSLIVGELQDIRQAVF